MMTRHERFPEVAGDSQYTALIKKDGRWWIGWIAEIPGVNCQEATKAELLASLSATLRDILELNGAEARAAAGEGFTEVKISV
jgi:predicted RNase H-like HicB family nuclease